MDSDATDRPDWILFNGGVMSSPKIRSRLVESIKAWFEESGDSWEPKMLANPRLDLAVAHGAAYYAMVRRGEGVRIAANLGRSYYMQVQDDPPKAICVIPAHAEPGQRFLIDDFPLEMQLGSPVQFPLWVSSTRLADATGSLVTVDSTEMSPLPPICTALVRGRRREETQLKVFVECDLSEIGSVGMYCVDAESNKRWKLEFDIRSTLETDRQAHQGVGEAAGVIDTDTVEGCEKIIARTFGENGEIKPNQIIKLLQSVIEAKRNAWPPTLLREVWQFLFDYSNGRRLSPQHEARWLNLSGFCLRPGYGVAVDDWRVNQTWRFLQQGLAFPASQSWTESMILYRRISGGLTAGQQMQIAAPVLSGFRGKIGRSNPQDAIEIWRMVGSLERIDVAEKIELGEIALREFPRKKNVAVRPAILWALGRIGSRQPVYGPLNTTVPADHVQGWLEKLIELNPDESEVILAVVQMARMTNDRYRDLSTDVRSRIADYLRSRQATDHYLSLVTEGGTLHRDEESAMFGDVLPLGIQLVRS